MKYECFRCNNSECFRAGQQVAMADNEEHKFVSFIHSFFHSGIPISKPGWDNPMVSPVGETAADEPTKLLRNSCYFIAPQTINAV